MAIRPSLPLSPEEIYQVHHVLIVLGLILSSRSIDESCLILEPIPRPCYYSLKLLHSRPRVRAGILALLAARVLVESLMQPHLTPVVGCLLVSHMSYIPLQSPQVIRGRLWRWWWSTCSLLQIILELLWYLTLRQPGHAILLNEGSSDRRSDDLARGDWHSVKLAEARD